MENFVIRDFLKMLDRYEDYNTILSLYFELLLKNLRFNFNKSEQLGYFTRLKKINFLINYISSLKYNLDNSSKKYKITCTDSSLIFLPNILQKIKKCKGTLLNLCDINKNTFYLILTYEDKKLLDNILNLGFTIEKVDTIPLPVDEQKGRDKL